MSEKLIQKAGDDSTNIQVANIQTLNLVQGMSREEAKEMLNQLFKDNFPILVGIARETAEERIKKFNEKFLAEMAEKSPESLSSVKDPDFLFGLIQAQTAYARRGTDDLGNLLVDFLIERASNDQESLIQVTLNEAIQVAPKLIGIHFDILSVIFLLRYTRDGGVNSRESFWEYLQKYIEPFLGSIRDTSPTFEYLEYTGCGKLEISSFDLYNGFRFNYQGLFSKVFSLENRNTLQALDERINSLIIPYFTDSSKFQINCMTNEEIRDKCHIQGISEENASKIIKLFDDHTMNPDEIKDFILNSVLWWSQVNTFWTVIGNHFSLATVGKAIARANIKRKLNIDLNLAIWVKE